MENKRVNKKLKFRQDNHDNLTIWIYESDLIMEIRKFFKWRVGDMIDRFQREGSTKYDAFIEYLYHNGYDKN